MKVFSPHRYELPGLAILPKGESEIGEMSAHAKKHFDKLVAAGIVKVLDAPKATPSVTKAAPTPERKAEPAPAADSAAAPVDVASKRKRARED